MARFLRENQEESKRMYLALGDHFVSSRSLAVSLELEVSLPLCSLAIPSFHSEHSVLHSTDRSFCPRNPDPRRVFVDPPRVPSSRRRSTLSSVSCSSSLARDHRRSLCGIRCNRLGLDCGRKRVEGDIDHATDRHKTVPDSAS